jgi:hypothetical protein
MEPIDKRRAAAIATLLVLAGVAGGYVLGRATDKTKTTTVTVGEPLQTSRPPYGQCDKLGINSIEGKQGTCIRAGITYTVVNRHTPLDLEQVRARLVGVTTADSVKDVQAKKGATYVISTLTVTNRLNTAARFDDADQVVLANAKSEYAEDRRASNLLSDSFVRQRRAIPPGSQSTGKVVFLTSDKFAAQLATPGVNFIVANFNDAGRIDRAKRLGSIRVWK